MFVSLRTVTPYSLQRHVDHAKDSACDLLVAAIGESARLEPRTPTNYESTLLVRQS